ncbi:MULTISPECIES: hypothetical protein [Pseudonocardia]|uniref:Uncharacterized protein n=1 Tax=Pseudonocardia oroxyli TaxID=366584 RepID=A0A1G7QHN9_PSEOR|nr:MULTISPECIES: hypothetical protein [Pseudonocardia]MCF7551159.1 hypothetical protein [Pseudonocardia sp. WMMC193]SDF97975.1 hypothetical protein SAMN05216377_10884 [Pseudonocardia oroxyli]
MSDAISDSAVVAVLRPFVRATRPILRALRESDPFGLRTRRHEGSDSVRDKLLDGLASVKVPGTAAWADMDVAARTHWWIRRVGRFTTAIAAIPGLGGALAQRLPVTSAVGAAAQGMLLVAVAGEHGVTDEDELVALLAWVLFRRKVAQRDLSATEDAAADRKATEIKGDLAEGDTPMAARIASAVWRLGRALFAVEDELDQRHHGRFYHRFLAMLPVVGVLGKYLGEWSGLKKAAREAEKWIAER